MLLPSQLPARRVDVAAAAFSHVGVHAIVSQNVLERDDVVRFWPAEG
jgi:hypothetical protein